MKGNTLAVTAILNSEQLYGPIQMLRTENLNLKTENQILKTIIGE